ncbi:hypothetical protein [Haloferula sargassicola]|uniref:Uncharacterized protein n=1 Tax=Haloferula sargassicola TaxID=490096 RepID=A0ABP9URL5_9BACT
MNNRILTFFSNPWIGIVGSFASIIGIPLGIYFARSSVVSPKLLYYVHPVRTPIVTPGVASDLKMFHRDRELTGAVNSIQLAVWNSGNKPIRRADVLRPITIGLPDGCMILESALTRISRPETGLKIDDKTDLKAPVPLSFDILEPDDGAIVQLVYEGPSDCDVSVVGAVVGQRQIQAVTFKGDISTPLERYEGLSRSLRFPAYTMIGVGTIACAIPLIFARRYRVKKPDSDVETLLRPQAGRKLRRGIMTLIFGLVYIGGGIYLLLRSSTPSNPFGF